MKKKITIGAIIALVVIVIAFLGIRNQMSNTDDENVVKIGAIIMLTGVGGDFGKEALTVLQFAQEQARKLQKDQNAKIEFLIEDSKSTPQGAINAYRALRLKHPDCKIIYTQGSAVGAALSAVTANDDIVLISASTNSDPIKSNPNFFQNWNDQEASAELFVESTEEFKRGLLFYYDDDNGTSVYNALNRLRPNKFTGISFNNASQVRNLVAKSNWNDYEVVMIVGFGPNLINIIKSLREHGYTGPIQGSTDFLTGGTKKALEGMTDNIFCMEFQPLPPEIILSYKNFSGKENFSNGDIAAYNAAMLLAKVSSMSLEQQNKLDSTSEIIELMTNGENLDYSPSLKAVKNQNFDYKMLMSPL